MKHMKRRPAAGGAPASVLEGPDDEPTLGLVALTPGLAPVLVAQVLVHQSALDGAHRVEPDGTPEAAGALRRLVGLAPQQGAPPLAVAGGVDGDALLRARVERGPVGQVLQRIDRLAVAPDEDPEVLAVHRGLDRLIVLVHLKDRLEVEGVEDRLEELADAVRARAHQRRRPDRFLRRRGGGGGPPAGAGGRGPRAPPSARAPRPFLAARGGGGSPPGARAVGPGAVGGRGGGLAVPATAPAASTAGGQGDRGGADRGGLLLVVR